jgi:hypothetical protein
MYQMKAGGEATISRERRTVMRKVLMLAMLAAFVAAVSVPVTVQAAEKVKGEVVMKVGSTVDLFHSGTADVKKEICVGDVIPVYRETMAGGHTTVKEVGKVKVVGYEGEHYFKAEIVKGEIKPGDVAKKTTAYCLVQKR